MHRLCYFRPTSLRKARGGGGVSTPLDEQRALMEAPRKAGTGCTTMYTQQQSTRVPCRLSPLTYDRGTWRTRRRRELAARGVYYLLLPIVSLPLHCCARSLLWGACSAVRRTLSQRQISGCFVGGWFTRERERKRGQLLGSDHAVRSHHVVAGVFSTRRCSAWSAWKHRQSRRVGWSVP